MCYLGRPYLVSPKFLPKKGTDPPSSTRLLVKCTPPYRLILGFQPHLVVFISRQAFAQLSLNYAKDKNTELILFFLKYPLEKVQT